MSNDVANPDASCVRRQKAKIVAICLVLAILYGIVHDQITARLCVEYFTIAHPRLVETDSPMLLGFFWGISATWGIGVLFGILLAQITQSRGLPPMSIAAVTSAVVRLSIAMALCASIAGLVGYELARHSAVELSSDWDPVLTPTEQDRFIAVWCAHGASYVVGLIGATLIVIRSWRMRQRPKLFGLWPKTRAELMRAAIGIAVVALIAWWRWSKR